MVEATASVKGHAGDRGEQIDTSRGKADLVDSAHRREVLRCYAVRGQRSAKCDERTVHSDGVFGARPHQDVQVARCARRAMRGEGMGADDDELASLSRKGSENVLEVFVHIRLHSRPRRMRPGISDRQ